jgi:hypothetical protein
MEASSECGHLAVWLRGGQCLACAILERHRQVVSGEYVLSGEASEGLRPARTSPEMGTAPLSEGRSNGSGPG